MFFGKKKEEIKDEDINVDYSNNIGRQMTTIENAKELLYFPPKTIDPREFIDTSKGEFFGLLHNRGYEYKKVHIPHEAINHKLLVGITRSGKGILAGLKCYESLQFDNKGLIYIDVKKEAFTPQIIIDTLKVQNKEENFQLVLFPNDFGYTGFNDDDTLTEVWEKLCVALSIEPTENPAVDHYRRTERMTLLKLLKVGWKKHFESDWSEILNFFEALMEDYKNRKKREKEEEKKNVDFDKLDDWKNTFFDDEFYTELNFSSDNIKSLETIYIKIYELTMSATVYKNYTIDDALFNGKVLYIRADMENQASLQMLKILFKDISQRARKADRKGIKANCEVIADEISFYATENLSGALATMAGFGIKYTLQLQDIAQIKDEALRSAILTNCSVKVFYKISDPTTLKYVELLGGNEFVINYSQKGSLEDQYSTGVEALLNSTRVRAMWYKQNAILIAEYLNTALFISTSFIPVQNEFDWQTKEAYIPNIEIKKFHKKKEQIAIDKKIQELQEEEQINPSQDDDEF